MLRAITLFVRHWYSFRHAGASHDVEGGNSLICDTQAPSGTYISLYDVMPKHRQQRQRR